MNFTKNLFTAFGVFLTLLTLQGCTPDGTLENKSAGTPICIAGASNTNSMQCGDDIVTNDDVLPGSVDDVSIWSRVLTDQEVLLLYNIQSRSNSWELK